MKIILLLLLLTLPFVTPAQEIIGKKKKQINAIKSGSDLIIDMPEMSIWKDKSEGGSLYFICYFQDDKCYKTVSIYPENKQSHWENILNNNCARLKDQTKLWLDEKRKLLFRITPAENKTFALESTKSNE
ncbi:MAG: hypothetical protein COW65_16000 [Cytophagales bacterium CG18_big_fil_WC_8_21_14_2_50_42_9]|nr:MAG: hypothetical protein COW65_16000 [Cytophagales bacterium CG18_big_fil_WC_8_21_14_2_50_42_9]